MYKAFIGASIFVAGMAPVLASAEVLTTKIGDQTVAYVVTPPQRGAALSKEEILDRVNKSRPVDLVYPSLSPRSEKLH